MQVDKDEQILVSDDAGNEQKEPDHSSLREKLDWELKELNRKLEQKEVSATFFFLLPTLC